MAITAFTSTAIIDATTIGKTVLTASSEGIAADAIGLGATDDVTFNSVDAVDGSFSGSLISEVGGSLRVYGLGTEGDTDTEYIEMRHDGTRFVIDGRNTGAGTSQEVGIGRAGSMSMIHSGSGGTKTRSMVPQVTATYVIGATNLRYNKVYSVDGDFSGDINFASGSYINQGGSPQLRFGSRMTTYNELSPSTTNTYALGVDANRWSSVASVDGSFSGNLSTEVGGSTRLFNLGSDADVAAGDTEYLETSFDTNVATIATRQTGAGTSRHLLLDVNNRMQILLNGESVIFAYNGLNKFYMNTTTFAPWGTGKNIGSSSARFAGIYGIDGNFSGDVTMAGDVNFTNLPTSDPGVPGQLYVTTGGALKVSQ